MHATICRAKCMGGNYNNRGSQVYKYYPAILGIKRHTCHKLSV